MKKCHYCGKEFFNNSHYGNLQKKSFSFEKETFSTMVKYHLICNSDECYLKFINAVKKKNLI